MENEKYCINDFKVGDVAFDTAFAEIRGKKLFDEFGNYVEDEKIKEKVHHEICGKIRKFCRDNFTICTKDAPELEQAEVLGYDNCLKELGEFLDQIEQARHKTY